jgi:uncharacterized protein
MGGRQRRMVPDPVFKTPTMLKIIGSLGRVALAFPLLFLSPNSLLAQQPQKPASAKSNDLFQAIRSGNSDDLKRQLAGGADPNDTIHSYSALMAAALNGSVEQMKILLDGGAKVNYETTTGISALWLAIPDWDKTSLLLEHGADVQHKVGGYGILVKLAAMPGSIKLFRMLVDRGADPRKSAADNSLLYNAATSGDTSVLALLLRSGFNPNDSVAFGDYPINAALNFRSFATLKMLVDHGADVNGRSFYFHNLEPLVGFTPLMNAALSNDKRSFLYLLEHGADPNLRNKNGYTALMLLEQAETDDPDMTQALLGHGALPTAKASDGTDALYYAQRKGNTPSVEILKRAAAK